MKLEVLSRLHAWFIAYIPMNTLIFYRSVITALHRPIFNYVCIMNRAITQLISSEIKLNSFEWQSHGPIGVFTYHEVHG